MLVMKITRRQVGYVILLFHLTTLSLSLTLSYKNFYHQLSFIKQGGGGGGGGYYGGGGGGGTSHDHGGGGGGSGFVGRDGTSLLSGEEWGT